MPLDILQELEEQTKSVNDDALSASFEAMKEKAGASSEVMSVLQSIVDSMAGSSENLHGKLSRIIRDFETYDKIVSQSVGSNQDLAESWKKDFGVSGVNGIQSVNRGLTTSISLMRSVQTEIDKYHQAFSKIEKAVGQMKMPRFEPMAPLPTLGSIPSHVPESASSSSGYAKGPGPLQSFRRGGRVRGTSFTGDKNIVRVNSGEWIFTAKQMKNLARLTESSSPAEVFAKAGGNPSIKKYDRQGIQMFGTGGTQDTLGSLHREYYDKLFSSFGMNATDAYKSAKSSDERDKIEEIARLVKRIPAHLDELGEEDFKLDPDLKKAEEDLIKAFEDFEKNGLRDPAVFQGIFNKYQDTVNKKAAKAQQQNQQNQQNQGNIDKMFPNLTGHAKEFAKTLSDLNQTVKSSSSTKTMKENARNEMASVKEMLELAQKKNLTREQMIQREDIIQRYNKATSIDEKNQIAAEAHEGGQLSLSDMDRSIGAVDAATIKFNKSSEAMVESWKSFLGGTPTGLFAVGAAIGFAGKQLAGFMNNISGSVENLAKLSLQTGALKTNMDSVFGKGTFDYFRESLNLTREEMASLGPTLKDSFRSAGIEMEAMRATAENIKDAFGAMDPSKFQEALGVLGELTGDQQKALVSGGGSMSDMEGMYANLMAAGKSGQAADLIEQGVFGGEAENPNLSEGDKEIVKAIQDMKVVSEDISMSLKDSAKGVLPSLLKLGKLVGMAIPIATSISQILVTAKAMKMMIGPLKNKFNGFKIPVPIRISPSGNGQNGQNGINLNPNGGSNSTTSGGGKGLVGKIGGMIKQSIGPGMIVGAVSAVVAEGFSMLSEHLEKKARIREIKKENDYRKTFNETGYVTGDVRPSYDWTKANAAGAGMAAQGALWGAGIGGGIGTIIAPGLGTAIGGGIGLAVGAGGGYLLGMNNELTKQNELKNNPLLWKEGTGTPGGFEQWVMNTADNPIVKVLTAGVSVPIRAILKIFQGKGILESIKEGFREHFEPFSKQAGLVDEELLKIVEKTSADIKKIQQINQKNRKEMVASLRLQESVERLIKKISSGAYSRFEDMNVEGAQASNEILTSMGGSDAGYTANLSRILDNATGSYTKNMEQINQKRKEILNAEGVNYASRINSANQLVKEQARVAKKWLSSILDSIGEYDKIPSVIQNSLKQKISEMNLDSANKGLGMTSGMGYDLVNQNLQNSLDDASKATAQFLAEAKQVDQAMAEAAEQGKKAMERYREVQRSGNGVSWLRDDMVDANGKINSSAMIENQNRIKEKKASVDKQVQQLTGIDADSYIETMQHFDSLKSTQSGFDETRSKIKDMDEDEFEGKKSEMIAGVIENMEKAYAEIEATEQSNSAPILKQAASAAKSKVAERIKRLQEMMQSGNFSKEQMMGEIPVDALLAGSTTSGIEALQKKAESNPAIKKILNEIGMANALIQELSSASDTSIAALKSQAKMIEKYQQQVERVRQQANKLVSQIDNDPSAVFWRKAQGVMEAAKDSMMETGDIAGYAAATIQNTANELSSMKAAAKKAEADLAEKRAALQGSAQQMIQEGGDSEKINGVLGMVNQLSNARLNYAKNQTEGNAEAVKAQEQALNDYVNKNFDKNDPEYQKVLALISQSTALDEASLDALKKQKEIDSKNFQLFKTMISLMDGYKNTLDYMKASAQSKESDAGLRVAKKNLDARAAEQYGNEGIKAAKDQYQVAIKGIEDAYKAGMKQLDKERAEIEGDASLSSEEKKQKLEANTKKRETLTSERNTQQLEARASIDDQIVKAAQTEYEAKKRTSELALEALDTESDFLQSVGAPMEMIIANERQRVALMQEQAVLARQNYEKMVASGASQEEQLKARNDAMKAENAAIKATFGAQRSMIEKMFGNMIGAFSDMDFIQGPGNAANHYGYGYYENQDGSIMRGGQGGNRGWQERILGHLGPDRALLGAGAFRLGGDSSEPSTRDSIRNGLKPGRGFGSYSSSTRAGTASQTGKGKPGNLSGGKSNRVSGASASVKNENAQSGGKPGSPQAQLAQEKAEAQQKLREKYDKTMEEAGQTTTPGQTNTQPEQSQSSVEKPEIPTVEVNRLDEVIAWEEKIAKILVETAKFNSKNILKDLNQKVVTRWFDTKAAAAGGGGGLFSHGGPNAGKQLDKVKSIEKRAEEAGKDDYELSSTLDKLLIAPEKKRKENPAPIEEKPTSTPEQQKPEEPPAESKPAEPPTESKPVEIPAETKPVEQPTESKPVEIPAETKPELPPESKPANVQAKIEEFASAAGLGVNESVVNPYMASVKQTLTEATASEPANPEAPASQEPPPDPEAQKREERRRELRRQQLRLQQEQLTRESNKKGVIGSLWEGVKGTVQGKGFVNSYAGAREGYSPEEMQRMEEAEKMSAQTNPTNPANPNGSNTPVYSVVQPVDGDERIAPASEQNSTASAQTVSVEVMVKFNNQMFEEAVKRVVVSSGTAKQITKSGMEAQNA